MKRLFTQILTWLRTWFAGINPYGLMLGGVFFAASLTPSLIPRGAIIQGLLGGLTLGIGYVFVYWAHWLWRFFDGKVLSKKWNKRLVIVLGIIAGLIVIYALLNLAGSQNEIRERMQMPPVSSSRLPLVISLSAFVFIILLLLGRGFAKLAAVFEKWLTRFLPKRAAGALGIFLTIIFVFLLTDKGILSNALQTADKAYERAQKIAETPDPKPANSWQAGSEGSLVSWDLMGTPGRNFVTKGPTQQSISEFSGRPAKAPIRVYVGRAQVETAAERAQIALKELIRVGGFNRKVLIVASPTGTGWLDPAGHDPVEYLHNGDIATVAVQYSYLPSALSLVFETPNSAEQANATFTAVYSHWTKLPKDSRPELYVHGLSLGAYSTMNAYNAFRMINDPINGALWAGPPFPSKLSRNVTKARNPDSPFILPTIEDGSLIRFANQNGFSEDVADAEWEKMRIVFMQYGSDPIVFFKSGSFLIKPQWMKEPPAFDVSPNLKWTPFVTTLQLGIDLALSMAPPDGYGHSYLAEDYIYSWIAVTDPSNWSEAQTRHLERQCDIKFGPGCNNGHEQSVD